VYYINAEFSSWAPITSPPPAIYPMLVKPVQIYDPTK
jgi:hypothetical protein